MKNILLTSKLLVVVAIILVAGLSFGFKAPATIPSKITICHVPPGNHDNCHEITVSLNALDAHLDHGDKMICHDPAELEGYNQIVQIRIERDPTLYTTVVVDFQ